MKLVSVLAGTVLSSHYRGGTYIFSSNADGTTSIQQTQTWRDGAAGTSGVCTKAKEGTVAHGLARWVKTTCRLTSNSALCPDHSMNWPYTIGFSSNGEMGGSNDYCYGSYDLQMRTPSAGYRMEVAHVLGHQLILIDKHVIMVSVSWPQIHLDSHQNVDVSH